MNESQAVSGSMGRGFLQQAGVAQAATSGTPCGAATSDASYGVTTGDAPAGETAAAKRRAGRPRGRRDSRPRLRRTAAQVAHRRREMDLANGSDASGDGGQHGADVSGSGNGTGALAAPARVRGAVAIAARIDEIIGPCPTSRQELGALVRRLWNITIPSRAVCPGHQSPMDYLAGSFFDQRDLLIWANRGGGKTMMAAVATLLDAIYHGPARIRVLGGSFDQSDRLAQYIREMLELQDGLAGGRMTRTSVKLLGGSEIRMLAQSQRAVRGQHVQKIRCDEVDLFDPDVWSAVQFITRSQNQTRGSIEVLSTLHRSGGLMQKLVNEARLAEGRPAAGGFRLVNWCLWEVIERCDSSRPCTGCLLEEDCHGVARKGSGFFRIEDAIAIKARSSRASWEAEMLCRGAARSEHMVFGEFEPARHVAVVQYRPDWPLYRAIDFGYRSPFVCLWVQVTPGGRVHVLDEYVRTMLPVVQHAKAIAIQDRRVVGSVDCPSSPLLRPLANVPTYVDPAGRQKESTSGTACTELLASEGINCISKASTIADGLELIRTALAPAVPASDGRAMLLIHPRCTHLVEAMSSYHYPPPGVAGGDTPVKDGPDHLIDALRYFFVNRRRPGHAVTRRMY